MAASWPQSYRSCAVLKELKDWQKNVGAQIPGKNPKWDAQVYEKSMKQLEAKGIPNRDKQHANFLNPNFVPRGGWWDKRGGKK